MKTETITSCFEEYLEDKAETYYRQMVDDLIKLKPHIVPPGYDYKRARAILSHEIRHNPKTRFVRLGKGYYTVKKNELE